MPGPMKPSDVRAAKVEALPEEVFTVVNRLIAQAWDGHAATVKQSDVVEGLVSVLRLSRSEEDLDARIAPNRRGYPPSLSIRNTSRTSAAQKNSARRIRPRAPA